MLSVVVFCEGRSPRPIHIDPAEVLARTLGSLIAANVEGLLRDVAIAGPADHGLERVADHAGCRMIIAESEPEWLRLALEAARGPELFLLRSGRAPEAGFVEEAGDFLRCGVGTAKLHAVPEKFLERLFPNLAPLAGLIAPRELCLGAPLGRFETLAGSFNGATILRTRARRLA